MMMAKKPLTTQTFEFTSGSITATTSIIEFGTSYHSTGICFLDQMVDQLTSHGQLGVTMKVFTNKNNNPNKPYQFIPHEPYVDYAGGSLLPADRLHDVDIFIACGATLGMALRDLAVDKRREYLVVTAKNKALTASTLTATKSCGKSILSSLATSVFLCPVDEAVTEATLELELDLSSTKYTAADVAGANASASTLFSCNLAPYGNTPTTIGRRWIGCYECNLTPTFFEHLHQHLNKHLHKHLSGNSVGTTKLHLQKIRGQNAHHIVESTFQSFARVFRACLDELTMMNGHQQHGCIRVGEEQNRVFARRGAQQAAESAVGNGTVAENNYTNNRETEKQRTGSQCRSTKDTHIEVNVDLDRRATTTSIMESSNDNINTIDDIDTGAEITDLIFMELRTYCGFYFDIKCQGDMYMDDRHTSKDVSITLGQCINVALGNKAGLVRMGCAEIEVVCTNNNTNNGDTNTDSTINTATSTMTIIRCVMDLSNRPYFEWDLLLNEEYVGGGDKVAFATMQRGAVTVAAMNNNNNNNNNNDNNNSNVNGNMNGNATMLCGSALTCEMLQQIFESLAIETRATVHMELLQRNVVDSNNKKETSVLSHNTSNIYQPYPGHIKDLALAATRAFGTALAECVRIDPRRAGKEVSSTGTFSV